MTQQGPERIQQNIIARDHPPMNMLGSLTMPVSNPLNIALQKQMALLNTEIAAYNRIYNVKDKLKALTRIEASAQAIREAYPGNYLSKITNYNAEININFFNQVKQQRVRLNERLSPPVPIIPALKPPTTLEEMVAQISPEKLKKMMEILSFGTNFRINDLGNLYPKASRNESKADKEEREMFASFLANHTISYLGGGNAQNFRIQRKNSSEEKVLKVEYRFDSPKAAARDLRENALKGKMTSISTERQSTFYHARHGLTTCSLLVTPLIRGGDLEKHISLLPKDNHARSTHTIDLGTQMADMFLAIQPNYAFTDPKTSNWLVNENGKLQIADDKSFVPAKKGVYIEQFADQKGYDGIITSGYMYPKELDRGTFDVDSMHVHMLGKNLYQIMTNCDNDTLRNLKPDKVKSGLFRKSSDFYFDKPVFKTPEGQLIKEIIKQAIQPDAKNRISLIEARRQLAAISSTLKAAPIKVESPGLLQRIVNAIGRLFLVTKAPSVAEPDRAEPVKAKVVSPPPPLKPKSPHFNAAPQRPANIQHATNQVLSSYDQGKAAQPKVKAESPKKIEKGYERPSLK